MVREGNGREGKLDTQTERRTDTDTDTQSYLIDSGCGSMKSANSDVWTSDEEEDELSTTI